MRAVRQAASAMQHFKDFHLWLLYGVAFDLYDSIQVYYKIFLILWLWLKFIRFVVKVCSFTCVCLFHITYFKIIKIYTGTIKFFLKTIRL